MYAVARINTDDYMELATLTDQSKQEYCDRHGYTFFKGQDQDLMCCACSKSIPT
jgi:spore coat polysaccharide biosynthesis protein SpsF (cytidylyltransferase family)